MTGPLRLHRKQRSRTGTPVRATCTLLAVLMLPSWPALAQTTPGVPLNPQDRQRTDAGTLGEAQRRADERPPPVSRPGAKTVIRASTPTVDRSMAGVRLSVQGFRFEGDVGNTSAAAIEQVLAPWKGRELTFPEYEQALHALAKFLRANGHPNADVRISRAQIKDNVIAVAIQGLTPGTSVPAPLSAEAAGQPVESTQPRVFVQEFRVTGTDLLAQEEVNRALAPYIGRALSLQELDEATSLIANTYRARGFGLAQAFMPPQRIENGVVAVTVQPGVVDATAGTNGVTVKSPGQIVKPELVQRILAQAVKPGEPLNTGALEQALRVAGEVPGIASVKADLVPGAEPGTTQVVADVRETRLATGNVWADNHGSRYIGTSRLSGQVNLNSPSGNGEQYNLQFTKASGTNAIKIGGSGLVAPNGARVGASYARLSLDLGREIAPLNLNSQSDVASLYGTYPLVRSAGNNITASANLDAKRFVNNLAGLRDNSRRLTTATGGLNGDFVDRWSGQVGWGAQLTVGQVDLSDSPAFEAADAATAGTAGAFTKANFSIARLAPLRGGDGRFSFYTALSGQLSGRNLDPAEKFQLGGPTGVRAYPVGEGLGDQGALATAELRYTLPAVNGFTSQFFGFVDTGMLRQYNRPWAGALVAGRPNNYTLSGAGLGVTVARGESATVRLMYAHKIGRNPNPTLSGTDSDGTNKAGRILVFGTISF